jgi:glycosyltransferase involved in cell wall biosynthesis
MTFIPREPSRLRTAAGATEWNPMHDDSGQRRLKILFLHKQILFPRDTGGKIRVLNLLKHLARWHDVTYVCNLRRGEEALLPQMEALGLRMEPVPGEAPPHGGAGFYLGALANLASSRPYSIDRNYDPAVRRRVEELLRREHFDLLICDTVHMARHVIGLDLPPAVLFQHNVEAQILERHADVGGSALMRAYMRSQYRRMAAFEAGCGKHFDHVIAVSRQDASIFAERYGWRDVDAIDTAVDTDLFEPRPLEEVEGRVMFLGSMDWLPNQNGMRWFCKHVWPRVRERRPDATFQIVGRSPPPWIRALAELPGVEVTGSVPDVRPYLAAASVVVVPLLVGGGTRLKIYEAMAMARATVSTTIGAEGLPVEPGTHFLQADDPETFAADVLRLLDDAPFRRGIGEAANAFVRERYGSEPITRQFEAICLDVLARVRERGSVRRSTHNLFPSSSEPLKS